MLKHLQGCNCIKTKRNKKLLKLDPDFFLAENQEIKRLPSISP